LVEPHVSFSRINVEDLLYGVGPICDEFVLINGHPGDVFDGKLGNVFNGRLSAVAFGWHWTGGLLLAKIQMKLVGLGRELVKHSLLLYFSYTHRIDAFIIKDLLVMGHFFLLLDFIDESGQKIIED